MTSLTAQCGYILHRSCKNTVFTRSPFSNASGNPEIQEQRISITGFDFDSGYAEYLIAWEETLAAIPEELPGESESPRTSEGRGNYDYRKKQNEKRSRNPRADRPVCKCVSRQRRQWNYVFFCLGNCFIRHRSAAANGGCETFVKH